MTQRARIQEGLKFTTGMSGGARAASVFAQMRPGFGDVIVQAAGFAFHANGVNIMNNLRNMPGFLVGMTMGESDSNIREVQRLPGALPPTTKYSIHMFPGGHEWAPAEIFDRALTWMEREIYVTAPARAALQPAYASYFKRNHAAFAAFAAFAAAGATGSPWARYQTASDLLTVARARNLATIPEFAAPIREIQSEVARLRADPVVAKEAMASDSLRSLERLNARATPAKVADDYRNFAKRHAGTEAAKKAEEAALAIAASQPAKAR